MSRHVLYRDGLPCGEIDIPNEVEAAARLLYGYLQDHPGAALNGVTSAQYDTRKAIAGVLDRAGPSQERRWLEEELVRAVAGCRA